LASETTYTAVILSSVTDLAGNTLAGNQAAAPNASNYEWSFTTGLTADVTRPRVTITEPLTTDPGPTEDVPVNTAITAIFTEDMLPATISDSSFTLTCETPCEAPLGEVSYVGSSKSAVFTPAENLVEDVTYTATISSDATDTAGNQLAGNQAVVTSASDYIWMFTTVAAVSADNISVSSTEPLDAGMLAVCPNASINATFDIPSGVRLDPTTVNNSTFIIVEDADPLTTVTAESIELDVDTGTIMTFIPQTQLEQDVTYRATIKGGSDGVKDLIVPGNEMLEDYVWTFTTEAPTESCLEPVDLQSAAPFGSFGGTAGVTNEGLLTIVNGDLGTTGASTLVTGFVSEPGCEYTITTLNEGQVNGKIFTAPPPPTVACPQDGTAETEAIANQARLDAEEAYISMTPANLPGGQNPGNENLGGLTLAPGIYKAQSGAFSIQGGDLTLDAQGDQNAVWVFQMATTLTVGGPGADFPQSVTLINGAQAKNIFWQVGSSATINAAGGGTMKGTIIAQDGVSISTAGNVNIVTLDGRALSLGASVTVVNTVINVPAE
ncbi:MAG: ice-binding family protein, partial [Idiomarina sp.]|nr:ice-binding family protein [Idiomarina sp.]